MNKVLLPTDFSSNAKNAMEYAVELLKSFECEFLIFNSYERPKRGGSSLISIEDIIKQDSLRALSRSMKELKKEYPGIKHRFDTQAALGPLDQTISQQVRKKKVDLIVMGTRGASGVKEALLGSNTAKVLQKVGCVMITVPVGWKMKGLNKLAFATDYQGLNNPMEFSVVKALLDHYKPDLDLLNIKSDEAMKVDRDAENNWRNLLSDHSFNDISIEGEEITELITKYVEETKPDMLIMVSRRRGFIDRLLRKSVTRKLSMHLNVPIMVLHDNQDSSKE